MKTQNKLDRPYTKNPLDSLSMSPRPERMHQRAIKNLMIAITTKLEEKNIYEVLPEIELGRPNSKAPDLVVVRISDEKPVMFIEVSSHQGTEIAFTLVPKTLKRYKTVWEAFIYNYDRNVFYRVDRLGDIGEHDSYSQIIEMDLREILVTSQKAKHQ